MEVHDFAGIGIPNTHIMDVMDRDVSAANRDKRALDGFDALRRRVASQRQFRFERFDVSVDLDILTEFLADVSFQLVGDAVRGVSAISPSTSRSMLTVSLLPRSCTVTWWTARPELRAITMIRSRTLSLLRATGTAVNVRSASSSAFETAACACRLMSSTRSMG